MLVTQLSFHHLYNMRPMRTWGKWAFKSSSSASSTTTWRENRKSVSSSQETVISNFFQTYHVRIHHRQYWGSLLECLKTRSSFPIVHHLNIELANHSNCLTPTVKGHDNQFHILNTDRKASKCRVKSLDNAHAQHYTYHYLSYGW